MQGSLRILQAYMWWVCAFHVVTGIGINLSRPFIEMAAQLYGAKVELTTQFVAILHPLGAFMFVLGVFAAAAAMNPLRYRVVVFGFGALFLIRAAQRVVFQHDIVTGFQIDETRNWMNVALFGLMGVSLIALQLYVQSRAT